MVPLVQQDFHCFTAIFHQSKLKCEPFFLLGRFHLCLEKAGVKIPSQIPPHPTTSPLSASLTSDVWSHSAVTRLMLFSAMERKNEGNGNSKYTVLGFFCMLFAATVFSVLDSQGLNSSSSDPLNRRRILLCLSKKPNEIYNHQWVDGWFGEWGCFFTRAKHAAAPLRILDYGGIPPTALVKAWLWGTLILPEMSATSNIGNKTTWRDKQSWSGPTVTAEGALLFE